LKLKNPGNGVPGFFLRNFSKKTEFIQTDIENEKMKSTIITESKSNGYVAF